MKLLYNLGIFLYSALAHIVAPFNKKASLWVKGRKYWKSKIIEKIYPGDRVIWVHCASLGEFEQGRPVIELIKSDFPQFKIVLSFFSPSGYEIRKNYNKADVVCYLPSDTQHNAVRFIDYVRPELVIFVKYEFWHNYIDVLDKRKIPLYLVSGVFRPDQHFFKWYGTFFRAMLRKFERIFVQDQASLDLLAGIGISRTVMAGDTRFDRVLQLSGSASDIPQLEQFRGKERLLLAGSSWKPDEEIIVQYINSSAEKMKWVFAPHEIDEQNIIRLIKLIKTSVVRFSEYTDESVKARVLIIDNIGMLSSAYKYASLAVIGGGFGKGIHNILEPACWGIPVMFGPNHKKFNEALDLIHAGGARSFADYNEFRTILDSWLNDNELYITASETASNYIKEHAGATAVIIKQIELKDINRNY